jgi:DNA polymerase III delta prime subunit
MCCGEKKRIVLRAHQKLGISKMLDCYKSGHHAFFCMATGTGKTATVLCLAQSISKVRRVLFITMSAIVPEVERDWARIVTCEQGLDILFATTPSTFALAQTRLFDMIIVDEVHKNIKKFLVMVRKVPAMALVFTVFMTGSPNTTLAAALSTRGARLVDLMAESMLHLPDKPTYVQHLLELNTDQRSVYVVHATKFKEAKEGISKMHVIRGLREYLSGLKVATVIAIISATLVGFPTAKIVVASEFNNTLRAIALELDTNVVVAKLFSGGVKQRNEEIGRFKEESRSAVLLLSTLQGAHGLNLGGASGIIVVDCAFSKVTHEQTLARLRRLDGIDSHQEIVQLIFRDSVESRLLSGHCASKANTTDNLEIAVVQALKELTTS